MSIQIPVQTGSRNEVEPGKSGFAHFFEHLMFRGTVNTPPQKFREVMSKAGSRDNADALLRLDVRSVQEARRHRTENRPAAERYADQCGSLALHRARAGQEPKRIASVVSTFAGFHRDYQTANAYYRMLDSVQPADVQAAAQKYFTDDRLIVTTLSNAALPASIGVVPPTWKTGTTGRAAAGQTAPVARVILQKSLLPQLNVKFNFTVGSANDPAGKEGLAARRCIRLPPRSRRSATRT